MPQKNFSLYSPTFETGTENHNLVIEVGHSHMACIVSPGDGQQIAAFELFKFNREESANFENLFLAICMGSKLLDKIFKQSTIYINTQSALLIPAVKFNKETCKDLVDVMYGEDREAKLFSDHLPKELAIVNVFRVPADWVEVLQGHLISTDIKHIYSAILPPFISAHTNNKPVIKVQFYYSHFIVAVLQDQKLQVIQGYEYQTKEDVLYYLLNMVEQLDMAGKEVVLELSGMIDLASPLYNEIKKYFQNMIVEDVDEAKLLVDTEGLPLHYFTPFINLSA